MKCINYVKGRNYIRFEYFTPKKQKFLALIFLFYIIFNSLQRDEPEIKNGNLKYCNSVRGRNNSVTGEAIMGMATPGGMPSRSRPSSKMTKYVECWGADKPFANIAESTLAKNIELTVSIIIVLIGAGSIEVHRCLK